MKVLNKLFLIGLILVGTVSCKKFVEVPPPATSLSGASAFANNQNAAASIDGIYSTMTTNGIAGGPDGFSTLLGLSADEFDLFPGNTDALVSGAYKNDLLANPSGYTIACWGALYNCIYQANAAINGLASSTGVTAAMKQELTGEAQVIRAYCYFYLVNIYGDVPLVTSPSYTLNEGVPRASQAAVYHQIVTDLTDAQGSLNDNYLTPDGAVTSERVRPNKAVATALLARVYLYTKDWKDAETQSTSVIQNPIYSLPTDLNTVFTTTSTEAIWQLEMPDDGLNAVDGYFIIGLLYYGGPNPYDPITLNNTLIGQFETGDKRLTNWVTSIVEDGTTYYYPFKYKLYQTNQPPQEYPVLLRLGEQYLIRAEAEANLNNMSAAATDLNIIRSRAGLPPSTVLTTVSTLVQAQTAILHERQCELFSEQGHRWLDLIRTGTVNSVMSVVTPQKGGVWKTTDQLYPIATTEIEADHNLTQNPGY